MAHADAFLAKAEESLASAEDDFAAARFNACARNSYYAAFQASVAALIAEDVIAPRSWGHHYVNAQFSGLLVYRRKRYPASYRSFLASAYRLRADADYTPRSVRRSDVSRILEDARKLVNLVRERVRGNS